MDLVKPTLKIVGDRYRLELVFELVDHPSYDVREASLIKPVDVWFRLVTLDTERSALTPMHIMEGGQSLLNITKNTDRELRTVSDYYRRDKARLLVVARPAQVWAGLYETYFEQWQVEVPGKYRIPIWNALIPKARDKISIEKY